MLLWFAEWTQDDDDGPPGGAAAVLNTLPEGSHNLLSIRPRRLGCDRLILAVCALFFQSDGLTH